MPKKEAVSILASQIMRIETLKNQEPFSSEFKKWKRDTEVAIEKIFGNNTRHLNDFKHIRYTLVVTGEDTTQSEYNKKFYAGLEDAHSILQSMIEEIQQYGLVQPAKKVSSDEPEPKSPWNTGSFYLLVVLAIVAAISYISSFVHFAVLPIIIIGTILASILVIISQQKYDDKLSDKSFSIFLHKILESLPLLRNRKTTEENNDESKQ